LFKHRIQPKAGSPLFGPVLRLLSDKKPGLAKKRDPFRFLWTGQRSRWGV